MRLPLVCVGLVVAVVPFFGCSKKDPNADKPAVVAPAPADKPAEKPADKPADPPAAPAADDKKKGGCSYITEAEASEALGQKSKYRSNDGSENCIIDPVEDATATTTSVDFTVKSGTGSYDYLAKNGKPLDGVGDKAVIDGGGGMAQIAIVKGAMTLSMTVTGPKSADPALIKAFATKVFAHL